MKKQSPFNGALLPVLQTRSVAWPFARIVRTSKLAPQRFAKRRSLRPSGLDRGREKQVNVEGENHVRPINRIVASVAVTHRQHCSQYRGRVLASRPRPARLALSRELRGHRRKAVERRRLLRLLEKSGHAGARVLVLDWRGGRIRDRRGPHSRGRHPLCRAALRVIPCYGGRAGASLLGISGRADDGPI